MISVEFKRNGLRRIPDDRKKRIMKYHFLLAITLFFANQYSFAGQPQIHKLPIVLDYCAAEALKTYSIPEGYGILSMAFSGNEAAEPPKVKALYNLVIIKISEPDILAEVYLEHTSVECSKASVGVKIIN